MDNAIFYAQYKISIYLYVYTYHVHKIQTCTHKYIRTTFENSDTLYGLHNYTKNAIYQAIEICLLLFIYTM